MHLQNYTVLIKPDETVNDLIAEICEDLSIKPNEHFCFSAIEQNNKLKMNCIIPQSDNPFTPEQIATHIIEARKTTSSQQAVYIQPSLELWLEYYKPLLSKMVIDAHPYYEKLIPEKDELTSILYLTIVRLYAKGYYLHKYLIKRSFYNALNHECRKLKQHQNDASLEEPISRDEDQNEITLLDQLEDQSATEQARQLSTYTEQDYWEDMFNLIKATMLEDMSELSFDRILFQLNHKCVDPQTSKRISKYRQIFNPGYTPRPKALGKPKHRNKTKENDNEDE